MENSIKFIAKFGGSVTIPAANKDKKIKSKETKESIKQPQENKEE